MASKRNVILAIVFCLIFWQACTSPLKRGSSPDRRGTSQHKSKQVSKISKTLVSKVPLGPVTQEILQEAKRRYEYLNGMKERESDPLAREILQQEALLAKMNYYDLLPMPYRDRIHQTGKGVTIAVIDGGVFTETVEYLGSKFLGYHEMQPDFSIKATMNPRVFPLKLPVLLGSGDNIVEKVFNHGDDMIRFVNRMAPDANIICINNYNRNLKWKIKNFEYETRVYDAPLSISESIRYLVEKIQPLRPLIISLSEGINPYRSVDPTLLSEMQEQFRRAQSSGYLIVIAAGNISRHTKDSYKLGMNLGVDCPWVIPVGAVDQNNRALKSARFDPENKSRVLYAPAWSSSVATAKVAGLASLLLEKDPALNPEQIKRILFQTADFHKEKNNRDVYSVRIDKTVNRIE